MSKGPRWLRNAVMVCALLAVLMPPPTDAAGATQSVQWSCSQPLLPNYVAKSGNDPDLGEGVSYLYDGDADLHTDYAADARFVAPIDASRDWYDSGVRLGPYKENNGFIQIEVSHWERFDYRGHIAIAWALPYSHTVSYRDTALMVGDRSAVTLGITVRGNVLQLLANGREICHTEASHFVAAGERKYFQIRTETSIEGHNGAATVSAVRLKRDSDNALRPFSTPCVLHRFGVYLEPVAPGVFAAKGAFYPAEATYFTGPLPGSVCKA